MGTQLDAFSMDGAAHQKLQYLGMAKRQKANHPDDEGHGARLLKGMETILNRLYYIALGLALSVVLWGTMVLVLVPFAYGSEFGSSTITNSTSTSTQPDGYGGGEGTSLPISYPEGGGYVDTQSTRSTSDYARLGIVLSIVLVAVLASIAYFRRKK